MACWSENYHFIKEVYDFRVDEMNKWMDALEESSKKLITNKVYTSREFRRMRDHFRVSSQPSENLSSLVTADSVGPAWQGFVLRP